VRIVPAEIVGFYPIAMAGDMYAGVVDAAAIGIAAILGNAAARGGHNAIDSIGLNNAIKNGTALIDADSRATVTVGAGQTHNRRTPHAQAVAGISRDQKVFELAIFNAAEVNAWTVALAHRSVANDHTA
jgi:hypothetical protein